MKSCYVSFLIIMEWSWKLTTNSRNYSNICRMNTTLLKEQWVIIKKKKRFLGHQCGIFLIFVLFLQLNVYICSCCCLRARLFSHFHASSPLLKNYHLHKAIYNFFSPPGQILLLGSSAFLLRPLTHHSVLSEQTTWKHLHVAWKRHSGWHTHKHTSCVGAWRAQ